MKYKQKNKETIIQKIKWYLIISKMDEDICWAKMVHWVYDGGGLFECIMFLSKKYRKLIFPVNKNCNYCGKCNKKEN